MAHHGHVERACPVTRGHGHWRLTSGRRGVRKGPEKSTARDLRAPGMQQSGGVCERIWTETAWAASARVEARVCAGQAAGHPGTQTVLGKHLGVQAPWSAGAVGKPQQRTAVSGPGRPSPRRRRIIELRLELFSTLARGANPQLSWPSILSPPSRRLFWRSGDPRFSPRVVQEGAVVSGRPATTTTQTGVDGIFVFLSYPRVTGNVSVYCINSN